MSMEKPEIDFPGEAPDDLVIDDIVVGTGDEAKAGNTVIVHYVGVAHFSGWDQGVQGMKVGGRRQLTIPPHLGYGDRGAGGAIAPGETLIFVVDLLGVR